jgi:predicted enzyme related to lactoylglutathione lyase
MGKPVVHFEFHAQDPAALQDFYRSALAWTITTNAIGYGRIDTGSPGPTGGIAPSGPRGRAPLMLYVEVERLEDTLAAWSAAGGRILLPPTDVPDGRIAVGEDPERNPIGLIERRR